MEEKEVKKEDPRPVDPLAKLVADRNAKKLGRVTAFFKSINPDSPFVKACGVAEKELKMKEGKLVTKRQASKWLNKKGAAYNLGRFGL